MKPVSSHDFYGYQAYFLAAEGIGEFKECSQADKIVAQIVKWAFGSTVKVNKEDQWWGYFEPIQEGARKALLYTDNKRATAEVVKLLNETKKEHTAYVHDAINYLSKITDKNNPQLIPTLFKVIQNYKKENLQDDERVDDEQLRFDVANLLGKICQNDDIDSITALLEIARTFENPHLFFWLLQTLSERVKGNQQVIDAIFEFINNSHNKDVIWETAEWFCQMDNSNLNKITAILNLIQNKNSSFNRDIVGKIFQNILGTNIEIDSALITALTEFINVNCHTIWLNITEREQEELYIESSCAGIFRGIAILEEIGKKHSLGITALTELMLNSPNELARFLAAKSLIELSQICPNFINIEDIITSFIELIKTSNNKYILIHATSEIGIVGKGHSEAIKTLKKLLENKLNQEINQPNFVSLERDNMIPGISSQDWFSFKLVSFDYDIGDCLFEIPPFSYLVQAASSLGKIELSNRTSINALVKIIQISQDKKELKEATDSIVKILLDKDASIPLTTLINLTSDSQDEMTRMLVTYCLGKISEKISKYRPKIITALEDLINSSENEYTLWVAAESLWRFDKDNVQVMNILLKLIPKVHLVEENAHNWLIEVGKENSQLIDILVQSILNNSVISDKWLRILGEVGKYQPKAINALVHLSKQFNSNKNIRYSVETIVEQLAKFSQDSMLAINGLLEFIIIYNKENYEGLFKPIEIYGKKEIYLPILIELINNNEDIIDFDNKINKAINLIPYARFYRREPFDSSGKAIKPLLINKIVDFIDRNRDKEDVFLGLKFLSKTETSTLKAIKVLKSLLKNNNNEFLILEAAVTLANINRYNDDAIYIILQLISNSQNKDIHLQALECLEKIRFKWKFDSLLLGLEKYQSNNLEAIFSSLLKLIRTSSHEFTNHLRKSDFDQGVISLLSSLLYTYTSTWKNGKENQDAIAILLELMHTSPNESARIEAIELFGKMKIAQGNQDVTKTLMELVRTSTDESIQRRAINILKEIVMKADMPVVVTTLRDYFSSKVYNNYGQIYEVFYNLFYHYAQELTYPQFYQAWKDALLCSFCGKSEISVNKLIKGNGVNICNECISLCNEILDEEKLKEEETPQSKTNSDKSEEQYNPLYCSFCQTSASKVDKLIAGEGVYICNNCVDICNEILDEKQSEDKLVVGLTPTTKTLNLTQLPELLEKEKQSNPKISSTQIICIDVSEFIDIHNPSAEIYAEMVLAGCQERSNGEAETMKDLKVYWKLLHSDNPVILVFYDSTALSAEPVGFSDRFLKVLSTFKGAICVVTDKPSNKLKHFSPNDSQLIENIVKWIEWYLEAFNYTKE